MSDRPPVPVPAELARAYLCTDLPAIEGEVRQTPEDFEVEEVPLYEPAGEGEHLYLWIEKRGIPTDEAVRRLTKRLGVKRKAIGYAGLKDARAVTRQWISVQFPKETDPAKLGDDELTVLSTKPHKNKLKIGHLQGNRFRLRVRGAAPHAEAAQAVLERLAARGVPNYFGLQRFGRQRTTHRLGLALVREDPQAFAQALLVGDPESGADFGRVLDARQHAAAGDWSAAVRAFPPSFVAEQAAARALEQGRDPEGVARAVPLKWRKFYVSALQSWLFNAYLTRRLDKLDQLEPGEIARLHRNTAAFEVEAATLADEQARCAAQEISPSGPSFGRKLLRPAEGSTAFADEQAVLAELAPGLTADLTPALGVKPLGQRRALRTLVRDTQAIQDGDDLVLSFFLPKGCYATSVLEELFKRSVD